ncbi:hypothetical protein PIIN_05706 [Serendipita indica DSM 11827]|uniref:F-box domain-containing protein n=1 Tax=Serendipita indica (strain DSM 11827) TaxID=1109443 RepID=G4TKC8_SERID|nr:hypothetical protein PIIN_05706 [Serendipita indica DSM 11827]
MSTLMDQTDLALHSSNPHFDVNSNQNRVPTETEARGLRSLRETQQRIVNFLESEVTKLSATCTSISERNARLLLEVEAGKSELHHTHQLLKSLETQRTSRLEDIARIDALFHPVRRMPPELLQLIFKECAYSSSVPFYQAILLALVCRRWRAVALDTPVLWARISIRLKPNTVSRWTDVGRVLGPRLKSAPAIIRIHLRKDTVAADFEKLHLRHIPVIKELTLRLDDDGSLARYIPSAVPLPQVRSAVLELPSTSQLQLAMNRVHRWFPNVEILETVCLQEFQYHAHTTYPNIRQLRFAFSDSIDLFDISQSFPHLKQLVLASVQIFEVPIALDLTFLEHLQISGSTTSIDLWIDRIKCQSLKTLIVLQQPEDAVLDFVTRHRSVETLEVDGTPGFLTQLHHFLPNLKGLYLNGAYDELFARPGDTEPLFRSLEVLVVEGEDLTHAEFESIVRARALPRDHPLSLLPTQCVPLAFKVCILPSMLKVMLDKPHAWPSSELYRTSRRQIEDIERWTGYVEVSFTWE